MEAAGCDANHVGQLTPANVGKIFTVNALRDDARFDKFGSRRMDKLTLAAVVL